MLLEEERNLIVTYGKRMVQSNLTKGTAGNISILNREKGIFAIKPSGMDYFEIRPEDVVIMNLNGEIIEGDKRPSSEFMMHSAIYKNREDINSVVHCHSIYSTTLACLNIDLPPVHYMIGTAGKNVRCAKYATYGSKELAENCVKAMEGRNACILANHGLIAGGRDIAYAFSVCEEVEFCAEIYYRTKCIGEPVILSEDEMAKVIKKFETYGQNAQTTYKKEK